MKAFINTRVRYQKGLTMASLFPSREDGSCACGCGKKLMGQKKRWFNRDCMVDALIQFYIIKGDTSVIRDELFKRESGFCRECGVYDEKWQADHILSVSEGGGACTLDNFQTLCSDCHKAKTKNLYAVPQTRDVLTRRFYNIEFPSHTFGAANDTFGKNVERNTMSRI